MKEQTTLINNPSEQLIELAALDYNFWVASSYPGGVIVANSKGSVRLDNCKLKLGHRFVIKVMTKEQLIKSSKPKSYFRKAKRKK